MRFSVMDSDAPALSDATASTRYARRSSALRGILWCSLAMAIAMLVGWYVMILPAGGMHSAIDDRGDFLAYDFYIKTTLENGWYLDNPRLAAPDGGNYRDFPNVDAAHISFFSLLGWFTHDHIFAFNLFYLLSFALVALTGYWGFRRCGLALHWACAGAILFSLLPYHFLRLGHLFLAAYWSVPIFAVCALELTRRNPQLRLGSTRGWQGHAGLLLLVALATCGGIYYAFFGALMIALGGAWGALRCRSTQHIALTLGLGAVIAVVVALHLLPSVIYDAQHGINPSVATRIPIESEIYGLKLSQLLMPTLHHRLPWFAEIAAAYAAFAPLENENVSASLGLLAGAGFLLSLVALAFRPAGRPWALLSRYGVFVLAAFLWAGIGGFATIFAYVINADMRASNRISVYIAFFSIAATLWLMQYAVRSNREKSRAFFVQGIAVFLIIAAVLDQVPASFQDPSTSARLTRERSFVRSLEARLPANAALYQLPTMKFPESTDRVRTGAYDHLVGYLYSEHLRFSAGAISARPTAQWQQSVGTLPLKQQLAAIASQGFSAVWLDRYGYGDGGAKIASELRSLLGEPLVTMPGGRVSVFALSPALPIPADTVAIGLGSGWSDWKTDPSHRTVAWSREDSALTVYNMTGASVDASISVSLRSVADGRVSMSSDSLAIRDSIALAKDKSATWSWRGRIPPGRNTISLKTDIRARQPNIADARRFSLLIDPPKLVVSPSAPLTP